MTSYPVSEPQAGRASSWLRERRLRLALFIAFVESLLVVLNGVGWFWVVAAAAIALAFYFLLRPRIRSGVVHELAWVAAVSQVIALVVPVLWELLKFLAVIVLVGLALFLLAVLLLDRR